MGVAFLFIVTDALLFQVDDLTIVYHLFLLAFFPELWLNLVSFVQIIRENEK